MAICDLGTGAGHLELAMESLRVARAEAMAQWDDQTHRRFQEEYLVPLEATFTRALDAIHRLALVVAKAERECGPD